MYSIPDSMGPVLARLAINKEKSSFVKKHFSSETKVVNIKSLLDDEKLRTIQVNNMSSGIAPYLYLDQERPESIKEKYSKRVYDFVANNAIQIPLMLNGKRMYWVDISIFGDFYIKTWEL